MAQNATVLEGGDGGGARWRGGGEKGVSHASHPQIGRSVRFGEQRSGGGSAVGGVRSHGGRLACGGGARNARRPGPVCERQGSLVARNHVGGGRRPRSATLILNRRRAKQRDVSVWGDDGLGLVGWTDERETGYPLNSWRMLMLEGTCSETKIKLQGTTFFVQVIDNAANW